MYKIREGPKGNESNTARKKKRKEEKKNTNATALCIRPSFCHPISNRFSSSLVFASVCPEAYGVLELVSMVDAGISTLSNAFLLRANHMFQVIAMKIEAQSFLRAGLTTLGLVIRPCIEHSP
jgi:hypothetical protein